MYQSMLVRSGRSAIATFSAIVAVALVGSFFATPSPALAVAGGVNITSPATGASDISIDTTSTGGTNTPVDLDGPALAETLAGSITVGTHTLTLPAGWKFVTGSSISIVKVGAGLSFFSTNITPDTHSFSFEVTHISTSPATVMFSGLRVVPEGITPGTGEITYSGAGMGGISGSWGTLTTVPGTVTKVAFTTPPGGAVYGSALSPQPVVKTQDQFGNNSTSGLGASNNVVLSLTSGSGALVGIALLDIGTGDGNGTATFSGLTVDTVGAKQLMVAATDLANATSDSFSITAKPLTGTVTANNKVYDGNDSVTVTGFSLNGVEAGDVANVIVDPSGASARFDDVNAGPGKTVSASGIAITGAKADNYSYNGTATGAADITTKPITVTANSSQTKIYGEVDPTFTYINDPLISPDIFSGALGRIAGENVGAYAITQGNLSAGINYDITFVADNFTITARPITVEASASSKEYDGTTTSAGIPTITAGTLATGDTANFIQAYSNTTVATGKRLTPSGTAGGNSGNNYSYTFDYKMNGVITAKTLTVSGLSATSRPYDGTTNAEVTGTPSLVGIVGSDDVSLVGTANGPFDSVNAGNRTVTVSGLSFAGADSDNYTLTQPTLNSSITPKSITITPDPDQTKVYGQVDPVFSYTPNPVLVSDDVFIGALSRDSGTDVNTYDYTIGNLSAGSNYSLSLAPDTFAITPKTLVVSATGVDKVYNGDATATVNLSTDKENGDDVTVDYVTASFSNENVGTDKDVSVSDISITGGTDKDNYILGNTETATTADITPAELTATITASDKVYNGNNSATITGRSLVGVIGNDDVTPSGGSATFFDENVGEDKMVSATGIAINGDNAGNYSYNGTATGAADITPKTLVVSATGVNKEYDANTSATVTLSDDKIENDDVTESYTSASFEDADIGTNKPVHVTGISISGDQAGNYTFNETADTTADIVDTTNPTITLNGDDPVTIEVHTPYTDADAVASDNYDAEAIVTTLDTVDVDMVGVYTLNYNHTDANDNPAAPITRTVNVVDTVAPTLNSHSPITNAVNVAISSDITMTFSEPVVVEEGDITLSPAASFSVSGSGTNVITLTPTSTWGNNTIYTVIVTSGVTDVNGVNFVEDSNSSWSFTSATSYSIALEANAGGWNLISLPVVPTNTAIAAVLGSASSAIDAVWTYAPNDTNADDSGWFVYYPNPTADPVGLSNLETMTTGYGYWVSATADATISGSGTLLSAQQVPPSRTLASGWNLVGYYQIPSDPSSTRDDAFISIGLAGVDYTSLWGFNNSSGFFTSVDANAADAILPGNAFWISVPTSGKVYTPSNLN